MGKGFDLQESFLFAFARILCSAMAGLQRESAFAKGFGPIKWRGELRRDSAQDTPSRHSGTVGSFIWIMDQEVTEHVEFGM
jgi:hypothetical protein